MPTRLAAVLAAPVGRRLALVGKPLGEARARCAPRRVVAVVARGLAGQQHMEGVMIVVVPLRAVFAARRIVERIEQARLVGVVFQHQMDVPRRLRGERANSVAQLAQQRGAPGSAIACTASSRRPSKRNSPSQ